MYALLHALTPDVRRTRARRAPSRAARLLGTLTVTATALLGAAGPAPAAGAPPAGPPVAAVPVPVSDPVEAPGHVPVAAAATAARTAVAAAPAGRGDHAAQAAQAAPPVRGAHAVHAAHSAPAELARTGSTAEQLWLLGGVALSLTAAGVIAVAASRGRKRDH
ncbi:hypothetical protein [Streptomyces sp. t39]|uniref:hypothetical protein n=1 Tax=Streptomyces sp. t39 TaxID=1828156 RepID=UPI0011CD6116|nr:hypothetical protein [Streptomyces sp. t39]TXS55723.1 hypothetical protein EAO77_05785 [Streptomyces sp. t39]